MGTLTGDYIIGRCQQTLFDTSGTAWDKTAILLPALNATLRRLAALKPNVYVKRGIVTMVDGPTQTIPADGLAFIRALWNLQSDGVTRGRAILTQSIEQYTTFDPDWPSATPDTTIIVALNSDEDPKTFDTSPPAISGMKALVMYSAIPSLAASTDIIPVDDSYEDLIYFGTLAHAYEKNTNQGDTSKASFYFNLFMSGINPQWMAEKMVIGDKPDTNG